MEAAATTIHLADDAHFDVAYGDVGEDAIISDGEADGLYGGAGHDTLTGGFFQAGEDGDDVIQGPDGLNCAIGGTGNDVTNGADSVDTFFDADGDDTLTGASGNDRLGGGSGIDTMFGGIGSDRLNSGSGADTVAGGVANDTYIVDTATDVVQETAVGGFEDVIRSDALSYTLGSGFDGYVERVNINKTAGDADLRGNGFDNTLVGNDDDNKLFGLSGSDILNGRDGDDNMVVDTASDQVRENPVKASIWSAPRPTIPCRTEAPTTSSRISARRRTRATSMAAATA